MKLFVEEQESAIVRTVCNRAQYVSVSQITWAEMFAALALKQRTRQIDLPVANRALEELRTEWARYQRLGVDRSLIVQAGDLAWRFGLRAYDSVQLATAHLVHLQLGASMVFCCFDKQLNAAAQSLNIQIAHP